MTAEDIVAATLQFREDDRFHSGYCPEFALALHSSFGGQLEVIWRTAENEDEPVLSHVILSRENEDYDQFGAGAYENWENNWWQDPEYPSEFQSEEVTPEELVLLVTENRQGNCLRMPESVDWKMVESLKIQMAPLPEARALHPETPSRGQPVI